MRLNIKHERRILIKQTLLVENIRVFLLEGPAQSPIIYNLLSNIRQKCGKKFACAFDEISFQQLATLVLVTESLENDENFSRCLL